MNLLLCQAVHNLRIKKTGKIRVDSLVTRNKLVRKREPRHESTLFEPKDSTKGPREEDALYAGKANKACGKVGIRTINPLHSPLGLLLYARNRLCRP